MSGTLKGEEPFTCHVTINSRSVTFHMYFQMFLTLSLTKNQSLHFQVGHMRAIAEDERMRNKFGQEWEHYAMKVRYWFVPGLVHSPKVV